MALLRYRIVRTADTYQVKDHGEPTTDEDGSAVYVDGPQATIVHEAPYTPEGKAECQFKVLTLNAQERAERQANGAAVATNEPTDSATFTTADVAAVTPQEG